MSETECVVETCGREHGPRPAEPGSRLCIWHLERLPRDVAVTPLLVRWLTLHTTPGTTPAEPVSGSREAPTPIRLDIMSMLLPGAVHPVAGDDQIGPPSIPSTLAAWAWQVCEERGLHGPQRWDDVATLARWLAPHIDWCAARDWAGQMVDEIAALRRCAHGLVPWKVHRQEKPAPCPRCDLLGLVQIAGENYVECDERVGGCGRLLSVEEYDAHVQEIVGSSEPRVRGVAA